MEREKKRDRIAMEELQPLNGTVFHSKVSHGEENTSRNMALFRSSGNDTSFGSSLL